jgi:hypothetical protein
MAPIRGIFVQMWNRNQFPAMANLAWASRMGGVGVVGRLTPVATVGAAVLGVIGYRLNSDLEHRPN